MEADPHPHGPSRSRELTPPHSQADPARVEPSHSNGQQEG